MKKILFSILFLFTFFWSLAKINTGDGDFRQSEDAEFMPVMVLVSEGEIEEMKTYLEIRGAKILRTRKDIILAFLPIDFDFDEPQTRSGHSPEIIRPRFNIPSMDTAKDFNGAILINQGLGLPGVFDGSGVVVGVCDIGIDTRHPTFLSADGKECRIKKVVHYEEDRGLRTEYSTREEIYAWQTDNEDQWHASHVTGIAAGAYAGNGFGSLAPGADIVFTASQLSDVGLLAGVEDIIEYAKTVGKPAVINLSMGNTLGPHDGSSLFSRYLDYCAEDAIICVSAGNDGSGGEPKALSFDFTNEKATVSVRPTDWSGLHNYGITEVWSSDDRPFKFTFFLYNETDSGKNIYFKTLDFSEDKVTGWRVSADREDPDYDAVFASVYNKGYILIEGGLSNLNGRYVVSMEMDCETNIYSPQSNDRWALYWPGIKIDAEEGCHVDFFTGSTSFLRNVPGSPSPGSDLSISDLATGFNIISVGMTNNKTTERKADGRIIETGYQEGEICKHSSYGTLADGRILPVTCAPGAAVVSAMNSRFISKFPEERKNLNVIENFNGKEAYWISNTGTSMSSPFVAGAIATWLQAYPQLKSGEALEIINATNTHNFPDANNPRNGKGWFNAYAGMQKVLETASLGVDVVELNGIAMKFERNFLKIENLYPDNMTLRIFDTSGIALKEERILEGYSQFDLSDMCKGIYLAVVDNGMGIRKFIKLFVN